MIGHWGYYLVELVGLCARERNEKKGGARVGPSPDEARGGCERRGEDEESAIEPLGRAQAG